MHPKRLALLYKVWKLTTSPIAGEAASALDRARVLVDKEGKTLDDIPGLLRGFVKPIKGASSPRTPPPSEPSEAEARERAKRTEAESYAEHERRQWHRDRAKREAPARADVLARYGGLEAVLAWTPQEELLRSAVAHWSVYDNRPRAGWTRSIDGLDRLARLDGSMRVARALSDALPLPTTITAAAAEYDMWMSRERDIGLAMEDTFDTVLDLPARFRRDIVCGLLETGLRAVCLDDVLIRQRHLVGGEMSPEIELAVLHDLKALAKVAASSPNAARRPSKSRSRTTHPHSPHTQSDLFHR